MIFPFLILLGSCANTSHTPASQQIRVQYHHCRLLTHAAEHSNARAVPLLCWLELFLSLFTFLVSLPCMWVAGSLAAVWAIDSHFGDSPAHNQTSESLSSDADGLPMRTQLLAKRNFSGRTPKFVAASVATRIKLFPHRAVLQGDCEAVYYRHFQTGWPSPFIARGLTTTSPWATSFSLS